MKHLLSKHMEGAPGRQDASPHYREPRLTAGAYSKMDELQERLDAIRRFLHGGLRFGHKVLVGENEFFDLTSKWKKSLPEVLRIHAHRVGGGHGSWHGLALMDELEVIVDAGFFHLWGRTIIDLRQAESYLYRIEKALIQIYPLVESLDQDAVVMEFDRLWKESVWEHDGTASRSPELPRALTDHHTNLDGSSD